MPLHPTFFSTIPSSKISLREALANPAAPMPIVDYAESNHSTGRPDPNSYSCDSKCTTITLAVAIPVLFLLCIGGLVCCLWYGRQKKRDAQRKMDEERDVELRKLGGSEEWGVISEARSEAGVSVRGVNHDGKVVAVTEAESVKGMTVTSEEGGEERREEVKDA